MKTIMIAAVGFGYATANLHNVLARNVSYTTEVVTAYTTFCPAPTTLLVNSKLLTVTEATTLTISDCPCTIVKPHQPTSTPSLNQPDECASKCWAQFQSCYRTVPAPPQAGCGLDLNRCLGYDWYQGGKNLNNAPTACQKTGSPSGSTPTVVEPSPSPTAPQTSGQPEECAAKCWSQFQSCYRTVPAPPQAGCGLDLNRCLGYDWYQGGKNLNNAPKACQKSGSPGTPSGTKPSVPEVSPSGTPPNGSQPPTVAGASSLQPLGVIAVAAMAMLL